MHLLSYKLISYQFHSTASTLSSKQLVLPVTQTPSGSTGKQASWVTLNIFCACLCVDV